MKISPLRSYALPLFNLCKRPILSIFWYCLVSFWLALSSIEFVNTYAPNYCCLLSWPPLRLLLLSLGMRAYAESSPVTTDDASCSVPLGLVSTHNALLTSHSTCSAKLLSFQKAMAVAVIVLFKTARIKTNWLFEQTPPPHFCLKVVCKKGRIFGNLRYM